MQGQQPEDRRGQGSDASRPSASTCSTLRGVPMGELFGNLASWKTQRGRLVDAGAGSASSTLTARAPHDPAAGSLVDLLEVASAAADKALCEPAWRHGSQGLTSIMRLIGQLRSALDRIEVAVVTEAEDQGTAAEAGLSLVDWIVDSAGAAAPKPDVQHASRVVNVVKAMRPVEPASDALADAVRSGVMPLSKADLVARFVQDVRVVADPDAMAADVEALVDAASDDAGGRGLTVRELRHAIRYATALVRPAKDLVCKEERQRLARALHKSAGPAGMTCYRITMDPEGASVIDAAVSALAAPVKGPHGELDARSAATRRADALLDVVRRGVSSPGLQPKTEKAQIIVTIPLAHLEEVCRGAGLTMSGELLSAGVLRRMACDAQLIPMVLGGRGQVLDVGTADRLFTPAQRKAVWCRDQHCTFPGCSIPAQWTDVHHVEWWSRGGRTDLSNAALLCGRHHTIVHQRDLTATVTDTGVTWHV